MGEPWVKVVASVGCNGKVKYKRASSSLAPVGPSSAATTLPYSPSFSSVPLSLSRHDRGLFFFPPLPSPLFPPPLPTPPSSSSVPHPRRRSRSCIRFRSPRGNPLSHPLSPFFPRCRFFLRSCPWIDVNNIG